MHSETQAAVPYAADDYAAIKGAYVDKSGPISPVDSHGPPVSEVEACCEACSKAADGVPGAVCSAGSCGPRSGQVRDYGIGPSAGLASSAQTSQAEFVAPAAASSLFPVAYSAASAAEYSGEDDAIPYASSASQLQVVSDGMQSTPVFDGAMRAQVEESLRAAAQSVGPSGTLTGERSTTAPPPRNNNVTILGNKEPEDPSSRIGADDARQWVQDGLGVLEGRLAEGDRARQREYLERMAASDLANNRDEREFRLKLAEIEARYRDQPSSLPQIRTEMQQQNSATMSYAPIVGGLLVVGAIGAFLALKK